jgi:hypothetical protein
MRSIEITKELINEVDSFYKNLFDGRGFQKPIDNLNDLITKKGYKTGQKRKYIDFLILHYDLILRLKPHEFQSWIKKFNAIINVKDITETFYKRIVKELLYKELREKEYLILSQKLSVRTCVYCNASLAVVANIAYYKRKKTISVRRRKATFELDHVLPKSKYPFLATTFFNLIPCCANCNKSKSSTPIDFNIYSDSKSADVFKFWLDKSSRQKFWNTKDKNDLKIGYNYLGSKSDFKEKYDSMFSIQALYETQLDIVEELIHKKEAYTEAYKKSLITSFEGLFPDKAIINRLLIGNYDEPDDIFKRPLAKFTQDIAKDIDLI